MRAIEEDFEFFESIMQEDPVGENHGNQALDSGTLLEWDDRASSSASRPRRPLSSGTHEVRDDTNFLDKGDFHYYGMFAHRGVLDSDEFVAVGELGAQLEEHLGCSLERIDWLYGPGYPEPERRAAKEKMDEQFLQIQEGGGNMSLLASLLGWTVLPHGECRKMDKALKRARKRRLDGHSGPAC